MWLRVLPVAAEKRNQKAPGIRVATPLEGRLHEIPGQEPQMCLPAVDSFCGFARGLRAWSQLQASANQFAWDISRRQCAHQLFVCRSELVAGLSGQYSARVDPGSI